MVHKRVFLSLFINYPYFFSCQHDQLVEFYSDRLKKRGLSTGQVKKGGLRHGSGSKKMGVLGTGQVKKGGSLLRHIPVLATYVSAPPPRVYSEVRYFVPFYL